MHVFALVNWHRSPMPFAGLVHPLQTGVASLVGAPSAAVVAFVKLTLPTPLHVCSFENSEQVGPNPVRGSSHVHVIPSAESVPALHDTATGRLS